MSTTTETRRSGGNGKGDDNAPAGEAQNQKPRSKGLEKSVSEALLDMVPGAGAGAITKTCIAPLERVKILFQLQGMREGPQKYVSILQTLKVVKQEEGILGWYKGNGANVLRVIPVYALKFAFNDWFNDLVRAPGQVGHNTMLQLLQAGTLAGLFQQMITYPLETIRTRLSVGAGLGLHYNGIVDCCVTTVRKEGFTALYKGLGPTLLTGAPYVGLQMTAFTVFERQLPESDSPFIKALLRLGCGALAGVTAQSITYPGDTIRRRMQTNGANGVARVYSTSWNCFMSIVRNEGFTTLYSGMSTNIIRALPGASIQFFAYGVLKDMVAKYST